MQLIYLIILVAINESQQYYIIIYIQYMCVVSPNMKLIPREYIVIMHVRWKLVRGSSISIFKFRPISWKCMPFYNIYENNRIKELEVVWTQNGRSAERLLFMNEGGVTIIYYKSEPAGSFSMRGSYQCESMVRD